MIGNFLFGYCRALRDNGLEAPVLDFKREFGEYLLRTKGWSMSCGPVDAIRRETRSGPEAWSLYWKLVDEFRESVLGPRQ